MRAYGSGVLPVKTIEQACDIILSESGKHLHVPIVGSALARTAGMLGDIHLDLSPRGWRLSSRPQRATRLLRDDYVRAMDEMEAAFGSREWMKTQVIGPWSLAASVELANGHRAITDSGARKDIAESLVGAVDEHLAELRKRCGVKELVVQVDEPLLSIIHSGELEGTSSFEEIAPVHLPELVQGLAGFKELGLEVILGLRGQQPVWEVAGDYTLMVDRAALAGSANLDAAGAFLVGGGRINKLSVVLAGEDIQAEAEDLVRLWTSELALDPALMAQQLDLVAGDLGDNGVSAGRAYAHAVGVAELLERSGGYL